MYRSKCTMHFRTGSKVPRGMFSLPVSEENRHKYWIHTYKPVFNKNRTYTLMPITVLMSAIVHMTN